VGIVAVSAPGEIVVYSRPMAPPHDKDEYNVMVAGCYKPTDCPAGPGYSWIYPSQPTMRHANHARSPIKCKIGYRGVRWPSAFTPPLPAIGHADALPSLTIKYRLRIGHASEPLYGQ
jgi:hypothetical protein